MIYSRLLTAITLLCALFFLSGCCKSKQTPLEPTSPPHSDFKQSQNNVVQDNDPGDRLTSTKSSPNLAKKLELAKRKAAAQNRAKTDHQTSPPNRESGKGEPINPSPNSSNNFYFQLQPPKKGLEGIKNSPLDPSQVSLIYQRDLEVSQTVLNKIQMDSPVSVFKALKAQTDHLLESGVFHSALPKALNLLLKRADPIQRELLILRLLKVGSLSRSSEGLGFWEVQHWLLSKDLPPSEDLKLLELFNQNDKRIKVRVRDYLTARHGKNFGQNYLIWKNYLKAL